MSEEKILNVSRNKCVGCGICESKCPVDCISVDNNIGIAVINRDKCTGCRLCLEVCPQNAIMEIKGELIIAIGTDDSERIKPNDHIGMSKYFQIWKYSDGNLALIETRKNAKYKEDETRIHGDPGKAKATASALKDVDVLVGKMMGPNIERLKKKFVPVIIREAIIKKAIEIIKVNINEIVEEKEENERKALILT
ncbi:MAG: 4Fe-4S binding protein [Acidobacteriota bacterium]|nr:4Fe-4S binding protein [Acidobacteriota bacterium]